MKKIALIGALVGATSIARAFADAPPAPTSADVFAAAQKDEQTATDALTAANTTQTAAQAGFDTAEAAAKAAEGDAKVAATAAAKAAKATLGDAKKAVTAAKKALDKAQKATKTAQGAVDKDTKKAEAESAKSANKLPTQNDITRPRADSATGRAWTIFDDVSNKNGSPASISETLPVATAAGINEATVRTQYARWRKFHGISGRIAAPTPPAPPAAPVEPAPPAPPAG